MKKPEIDLLAEKYDFAAESIKKTLSQMLSEIEQGKNISRENVKKYETEIVTLNSCYESVVSFLRQTFMQEVLPPEGSSIPEYVSAYHSAKDLKLQAITDVLERFVQVRSDVKTYASALQPSHKKAEKALTALRTANANGTLDFSEEFCQTDGMALFLRILEIQDADMDTEETMAMIQKITEYEYYSTAVQFGLLRRKYTLPENTEQNIPEPEETVSEEAQTPEELWKKAGILHPEPLCFHVEDEKLKKYQSDKSRKFGVKDFQSDMKKFKLVPALVTCKDFNGISAKMLSNLLNMKISDSQTMCSKLESLGYFISYEVEGYDKLYVLSPQKGKQVFLHKESSAFLKLPKMKNIQEFGETVEETANIALTRILRAKTFSLLKEIKPECKIGNSATCTNDECFVQVFDDFFEKNKNLAFINIISENPEQYCCLTEAIKECSAEMVIVIGINRKHAEALAQWLSGYFETQVKAGKFLYLDDETGIYYQYPEHTPFDFSDDTEDKTKELTSQDTKEITQEHPAQELSEDFVQLEFTEGLYTPEETKLRGESDETQENLPLPENIPEESPEQTDSEEKLQDSAEEDSVSEDTSPPVFPEVHEHLEKEDLSEEQYQEYHQTCLQMIAEGKFYCASAYARVLSEEFTQFEDYGTQVAFAFNDPLAECSYNSDVIYEAYLEYPTDVSEILVIPAVLRNYFLDYCNYDNRLHALQDAVSSNRFLEENPPLRKLVYKLQEFKTKHHHGVDFYADYHLKDRKEMEEIFLAVKKE
ncbi:MAG: hypothetical protein IJJ69_15050, partial [Oscillospiraceae bacterium]|nr:hypothetical protein [Oscillospiraceae bacterium]